MLPLNELNIPELKLNAFAQEVHQNAVNHGFWDPEPSFGDVIALCHSELSEALEHYRKHNPMAFVKKQTCAECPDYPCGGEYKETRMDAWLPNEKPDGIAVEMADCLIRILDWFGSYPELDVERLVLAKHMYNKKRPYRHGGKKI